MKKLDVNNLEKSNRARWSSTLASSGFTTVPNILLDFAGLLNITTEELIFIIHLAKYKWDIRKPFPSYQTLANTMGVSIKSVRRYAKALHDKGLVPRVYRQGNTNEFDLNPLIKKLEDLLPYQKMGREYIQKWVLGYPNMSPKEDSSKRINEKGLYSIKELIRKER